MFPHLNSVPYPSSVHDSAARSKSGAPPPWAARQGRRNGTLAMFIGTPHGREGELSFAEVRPRVIRECAAADDAICKMYTPSDFKDENKDVCMARIFADATFCLEPGGDSPYRKGFYDALLSGCVPVVFGLYNARVAPWFVPRGAVVELNETAYYRGEYDALAALAAIPPSDVLRRQRALAAGAHRAQYALDDVPGDAVETLLRGARRAALRREERGVLEGRAPLRR
jgi:hypothetical protein